MKLQPAQVRQVERGEKTEHRVLVSEPKIVKRPGPTPRGGRRPERTGLSATYVQQPFRPAKGDSLVIQTADTSHEDASKHVPEVRVEVITVRTELLAEIRDVDAIAEGFKSRADFAHDWMTRHSAAWPPKTEALCTNCHGETTYTDHDGNQVDCTLCDEVGVILVDHKPPPHEILERFDHKHGHHLVWVIQFELHVDVTRWVNKRAYLPPTQSIGEALEPDAPLLAPASPRWRENARRLHEQTLRDRDGARLAGLRDEWDRLLELKRLADARGVDTSKVIRRANQQLEDKVRRAPDTNRRAA